MPIGHIESIIPAGEPFESQYGTLYPHKVTFMGGVTGQINTKHIPAKFKAGDSVDYEVTKEFKGVKQIKITSLGFGNKQKNMSNIETQINAESLAKANANGAEIGMAMGKANEALIHNAKIKAVEISDSDVSSDKYYNLCVAYLKVSTRLRTGS